MASDLVAVENRLWAAADQLWANTGVSPSAFSMPALGLIFRRYADKWFGETVSILDAKGIPDDEREAIDYQAEGVLYLPEEARLSHLLTLTEGANLGKAIASDGAGGGAQHRAEGRAAARLQPVAQRHPGEAVAPLGAAGPGGRRLRIGRGDCQRL